MSAQIITQAAVKAWKNSLSGVSYSEWIAHQKTKLGLFWMADDMLEGAE